MILKKEVFEFEKFKFIFKKFKEGKLTFIGVDVKQGKDIIDWFEICLRSEKQ